MTHDDGEGRHTHELGRADVFAITQAQGQGTQRTRIANPAERGQADGQPQPVAAARCHADDQGDEQEGWHNE